MGRYYFTEQAENVPKIVFKEIDLATREARKLLRAPGPRGLSARSANGPSFLGGAPESAEWSTGTFVVAMFVLLSLTHWGGPA